MSKIVCASFCLCNCVKLKNRYVVLFHLWWKIATIMAVGWLLMNNASPDLVLWSSKFSLKTKKSVLKILSSVPYVIILRQLRHVSFLWVTSLPGNCLETLLHPLALNQRKLEWLQSWCGRLCLFKRKTQRSSTINAHEVSCLREHDASPRQSTEDKKKRICTLRL